MDDATLESLKAALGASPENAKLLGVLVRAYLERGQPGEAFRLLTPAAADKALTLEDDRLLAARACLDAREPSRALVFADHESARSLVLRARALLALDRIDEGRQAYDRAVAIDPTSEDAALADLLSARVRTFTPAGENPPSLLRVVSRSLPEDDAAAALLIPEIDTVTFTDVGGLESVKEQVRKRIILPFQKPSLFQRFKKRVGGGILMYGPPGCGKTLIARATAGECKARFYNVAISDVLDMYIGESEAKLHSLFTKARATAPSVLFFDEVEALGGKRQYAREASSSKLVSQFLSEMDGFAQNNQGVLIMAATNVPWSVDAAFVRPGRFDRFIFVPPPDREARETILRIHLKDRPVDGKADLAFLAKQTSGWSGADLGQVVETAADHAIAETIEAGQERAITDAHLKAALAEVRPTTTEWLTTARNYARYSNESGQYDDVLAFLEKHGKS
jgi:ATP-dependent 26S proteasome regulatory subunit